MSYQLLVEGVDRVGKSTFIQQFLTTAPEYEHRKAKVPTTRDEAELFHLEMHQDLRARRTPIIWDRHFVSEMVYAPLYRPEHCDNVWPGVLRNMATYGYVLTPVIVYIEPVDIRIMLPDERPNANIGRELARYELVISELEDFGWEVIRIQTQAKYGWRNSAYVIADLLTNLKYRFSS